MAPGMMGYGTVFIVNWTEVCVLPGEYDGDK